MMGDSTAQQGTDGQNLSMRRSDSLGGKNRLDSAEPEKDLLATVMGTSSECSTYQKPAEHVDL